MNTAVCQHCFAVSAVTATFLSLLPELTLIAQFLAAVFGAAAGALSVYSWWKARKSK